ncbi:MAG TPA: hypothetical protein VH085_13180 [Nocardioides sp.]|nr:hypothetical protein [Nocardioides sp.]
MSLLGEPEEWGAESGVTTRLSAARLMLAVTAATGFLGWVCLVVAGHRLGPAGYAGFSVVWGVLFGLGGAFSGLQQEVTRATYRAEGSDVPVWRQAAPVALSVCALAGLVVVAVQPAGLGSTPAQVALVVATLAGFGSLTFVNGVLSQRDQWGWVAAVLVLDSAVRTVALVVVLTRHHAGNTMLVAAIGAGPFAWLVLLFSGTVRDALRAPGADPTWRFAWRAWSAIVSAASTSALIAGFPFLLALVHSGPLDAEAGTLLAGLVLVRSPLLLAVFGLRPVLMRSFLGASRPLRQVVQLWSWCLAAMVVGGVLALLVGHPLLRLVMGSAFRLPGWQLAVLLVGSVGLAMLTVSGLALIATDDHLWSTLGWLSALTVTVALLALPGSAEHEILLALPLAPLAGLLVHALALARSPRLARAGSSVVR